MRLLVKASYTKWIVNNYFVFYCFFILNLGNNYKMAIQRHNHNSINFINILMERINSLSDDIYESLMDEDTESLKSSIKELQIVLRETQKTTEDEY